MFSYPSFTLLILLFAFSNFLFFCSLHWMFFSSLPPFHFLYIITLFKSFFAWSGRLMKVIRKPNRFYYLFNLLIAHRTYHHRHLFSYTAWNCYAISQLIKSDFQLNVFSRLNDVSNFLYWMVGKLWLEIMEYW